VLLFVCSEISKITKKPDRDFAVELNNVIRLYPGNNKSTEKTINNWRTEISSLFGLIEYDASDSWPGRMALMLAEKQDLISFFRYFLYYFQYPGGHLKPEETLNLLKEGIKFKPAQYLINVLIEGGKLVESSSSFGISKEEATHCIFNDLRSTQGIRSPKDTAQLILDNRRADYTYGRGGDVVRYAGDILDYMVLGDLLNENLNAKFYLKKINMEVILAYSNSTNCFLPYEKLRSNDAISKQDVDDTEIDWFNYVNNDLKSEIFKTNIFNLIQGDSMAESEDVVADTTSATTFLKEALDRLSSLIDAGERKTKVIGDVGESITIVHETNRLNALGRKDVLHLIKKIPETFAIGYDIGSYEGIGSLRRFIEVKTTVSRRKLVLSSFHMTPSEWSSAESSKDRYFIYRLMINAGQVDMFVIQDPVGKYKDSIINMVPRDGADIIFNEKAGTWEKILI
jgi:hypothetical protein